MPSLRSINTEAHGLMVYPLSYSCFDQLFHVLSWPLLSFTITIMIGQSPFTYLQQAFRA